MRIILSLSMLCLFLVSCSTGQKKIAPPVLFDVTSLPCDMAKQPDVAKLCGVSVTDMIFQTVSNKANQKICTYYKNVTPTPLPLINLTIDINKDANYTQELLFKDLIKNGIPGSDGVSKFKEFPDDRFKAVKSESNPKYNQLYLEVDKQALLIIEYDKSLVAGKDADEFERMLMELYLYGGPQL